MTTQYFNRNLFLNLYREGKKYISLVCFLLLLKREIKKKKCLKLAAYFLHLETPGLPTCSVQFSSVAQSCPTLCDPMNRSMPGLPVYHQLPGFTQTHAHRVSDAIQPSHPLSSPSPPAPNPSQHQDLLQ